jgi:hypothetical protein
MDFGDALMPMVFRTLRALHLGKIMRFGGPKGQFNDYFKGMEKVQAVKDIFGEKTQEVLRNLKVEFTPLGGYMWVNSMDGHLMISSNYLNNGDKVDIYLDLIHELVHVRQYMVGQELFDSHYTYSTRPTEIEAYRAAVREARRLGLSEQRICVYLKTEWMSDEDLKILARALNVNCDR